MVHPRQRPHLDLHHLASSHFPPAPTHFLPQNVPSAALDALWEDMVAEDAAYVGFKMAAVSRGLAGIGATHLTASSAAGAVAAEQAAAAPPTAALRRVTVPGFGQRRSGGSSGDGDDHGAAAGGATSGNSRPPPPGAIAPTVSATADLLLRNGVRGSVADPILSGPTCVPTGGGSVAGTSSSLPPAAAGRRSAAVLAAMLAPIRAPVDGRLRPAAAAGGGGASAPEIPLALLEAAAAAKAVAANKKVAVTQTVKFAGKTMTVTRLVTPGTAAAKAIAEEAAASAARAAISAASAAGEGAGGGDASTAAASGAGASAGAGGSVSLDALVANLDKPEAISTLTKSSLDWDTYKHAHGLDDELERCVPRCVRASSSSSLVVRVVARGASDCFSTRPRATPQLPTARHHLPPYAPCSAAKAGFVEKQAFLARVDERRFEVEREARAKERSRAEMEAMRAAAGRR